MGAATCYLLEGRTGRTYARTGLTVGSTKRWSGGQKKFFGKEEPGSGRKQMSEINKGEMIVELIITAR